MKVIIAGSRDFDHNEPYYMRCLEKMVAKFEQDYGKITMVVSGRARGPDKLGEALARDRNLQLAKFPAQWDLHGNAAGPIRNTEMGAFADGAIIMWDGESKGTKHMADVMRRLKKPFLIDTFTVLVYNCEHGPDGKIRGISNPRFGI